MDTSETYIRMSDCPEIQGLRGKGEWEVGDWFVAKQDLYGISSYGTVLETKEKTEEYLKSHHLYLEKLVPSIEKGDVFVNGDICDMGLRPAVEWADSINDYSLLIWLPRQDQLQKMLRQGKSGFCAGIDGYSINQGNTHIDVTTLFFQFGLFCNPLNEANHPFRSGEQLWLGFVKFELHQMTWDGDKWCR